MNRTLEELGPLIRERRGNKTQRQAALEIDISAATLSRVEAGKQPDLKSFAKICAWLGINPGEFLGYVEHEETASNPNISQPIVLVHLDTGRTINSRTAQRLGALILAIHQAAIGEDA